MIQARLPGSDDKKEERKAAEINHENVLRILIRGTDKDDDLFEEKELNDGIYKKYFDDSYQKCKEQMSLDKLSKYFDIPKAVQDIELKYEDKKNWDYLKCTKSQIEMCAQILSRVYLTDLMQAHQFFVTFYELYEKKANMIKNYEVFKKEYKYSNSKNPTFCEFLDEIKCTFDVYVLRGICGLSVKYNTNRVYIKNCKLLEKGKEKELLIQLHKKLKATFTKKQTTDTVQHISYDNTIVSDEITEIINTERDYSSLGIDKNKHKSIINIALVGHVDSGKSTLGSRLLFELGNLTENDLQKLRKEAIELGKESFLFAFYMDKSNDERSRGVSINCTWREY
eukprot:37370_1